MKPIDRRQFTSFYQNFPGDEKDLETLQEALEYMKTQVNKARDELIDMERKVIVNKKNVREMDLDSIGANQ